ncbi:MULTISPECIES: competence type IV pilus assembly protein ComGB [Staphylococcus]|uniref:Competence type IV pilus assembly protein ComGB n=1 Tax=Staphylococcus hsinchuensis TaxID=3051183 RepID=A0ABZ3ECW9_9STAP|nr:competence type IV pilus assembly protein ComGB [Staphylococcus sp. Marseille-Q5304]
MNQRLKDIYNFFRYRKLNDYEKIEILQRLRNLISHGFTLSEAFTFLLSNIKFCSPRLTENILNELKNGANCSDILKILNYPKTIVMLIYFSEMFSELTISLAHAEDYMLANYKAKKALYKNLQYPLVLLGLFLTMLVVLNQTIIPEFESLYQNMDVQVSNLQLYLSLFIMTLPRNLFLTFILLLILSLLLLLIFRKLSIYNKHRFLLFIPIIRQFFKLYKTYRLASEFSLFYKNGINLQKIVDIYSKQNDDPYLLFLANEIKFGTHQGQSLSEILINISCFDKDLITFIEEGEKKGKVDIELKLFSEMIMTRIERKLQTLIKFIQPCVFLLLAFLIVSLYLVIMLPMFDLMQTIK